jgi:uncharacterized protein (TIGR02678 family)
MRALLERPLLTAGGPRGADFQRVRRHAGWLRQWLAHHPVWGLQVTSELARLRKTPADLADGTRPARDSKTGAAFTRRRYVLLCLALAALERSDRQTTLGRLADTVVTWVAADGAFEAAGLPFDLTRRDQRRDLVQVARYLLDLGVLVRLHGDEKQFLDERGDVLYDIHRPALAALLDVKRGPSTVAEADLSERLARLTEEPHPDTPEGRNRRIRTSLIRRLLDDPVVYYAELDDDERAYLDSQRAFLLRHIHEATGLVAEVRQEGIAMVDPEGGLTDLPMPEEGTDGHVALLLAEVLAEHGRTHPGEPLSRAQLHRITAELAAEHGRYWRRDAREPGAEKELTEQALERLEALRLVHRTPGGVVPLAAVGRFALAGVHLPGGDDGDSGDGGNGGDGRPGERLF